MWNYDRVEYYQDTVGIVIIWSSSKEWLEANLHHKHHILSGNPAWHSTYGAVWVWKGPSTMGSRSLHRRAWSMVLCLDEWSDLELEAKHKSAWIEHIILAECHGRYVTARVVVSSSWEHLGSLWCVVHGYITCLLPGACDAPLPLLKCWTCVWP